MRDVDDLMEIQKRIEKAYCTHRLFISMVEFDRVFNNLANFGKFLVSSIPAQILQFIKYTQRSLEKAFTKDPKSASSAEGKPFLASSDEEEKEEFKQQGLNPNEAKDYFEQLKLDYYQSMRKSMKPSEIENILGSGVPDTDPDLPTYLFK